MLLRFVRKMLLTRIDINVQRRFKRSATCFPFSANRYRKIFAFAGWSALHFAAQSGSIEIVQLVFDRVQRPDPLTVAAETPLCMACTNNTPDVGKPKLENFTFTRWPQRRTRPLPPYSLSVANRQEERKKHHEILIEII